MTDRPPAAAKSRRRFISLGETVAILALAVSAGGLWLSWQSRVEDRTSVAAQAVARRVPLILSASAADDGRVLRLAPAGNGVVIQTQTIAFPTAIGAASVDTTGNARLEAGWFDDGLRKAIRGSKVARRLPVAIITRYTVDGDMAEDSAVYDIGFATHARMLRPDAVTLEGLTLVARGVRNGQARIDARWAATHPTAKGKD